MQCSACMSQIFVAMYVITFHEMCDVSTNSIIRLFCHLQYSRLPVLVDTCADSYAITHYQSLHSPRYIPTECYYFPEMPVFFTIAHQGPNHAHAIVEKWLQLNIEYIWLQQKEYHLHERKSLYYTIQLLMDSWVWFTNPNKYPESIYVAILSYHHTQTLIIAMKAHTKNCLVSNSWIADNHFIVMKDYPQLVW